ncbi:MAG: hypothetical protein AAB368_08705, partial [bacterium]
MTVLAAALMLAAPALAAGGAWQNRTWVEWGDAGLGAVAADLASRLSAARSAWLTGPGGSADIAVSGPGRGTGLGWEACRRIGGTTGAVVRAEWFAAGAVTGAFDGRGALLERTRIAETLTASLAAIEAGLWLAGEGRGPVTVRVSGFAGPAWGSLTERRVTTVDAAPPNSADASASGPGWSAEAALELGWRVLRGTVLTYQSGYRWARVPALRYAARADLDGNGADEIRTDAVWTTAAGRPLATEFSGWYFSV